MPTPLPDMTGQYFGKWYVEARDPAPEPGERAQRYLVLCVCGTESRVRATDLKNGHTTQCRNCAAQAWNEAGIEGKKNRAEQLKSDELLTQDTIEED